MAVYATYTFYTATYHGSAIASTDFDRLAVQASAFIDQVTFNRVAPIVTAGTDTDTIAQINLATCAVAEEIQRQEASGGVVSSETIGRNSVTYLSKLSEDARLSKAAKRFLTGTFLMYRGLDED